MNAAHARGALTHADRTALAELLPLLRRVAGLDPAALVRIRLGSGAAQERSTAMAFAWLPFRVLVSRAVPAPVRAAPADVTLRADEAVDWLTADAASPALAAGARDAEWRAGLPPRSGWRRVETLPDEVIRDVVRSGALALKDAAAREGVPDAQPRAAVADALLDSAVLTVHDASGPDLPITLRCLSALTRMGFLVRGGQAHVDVAGRWIRVVGDNGATYLERPGQRLLMR